MAFVVFEGERKLADVVTRAYGGDLKVADRKRAEAALVRANPHLSTIRDVVKGSLIVVPPVPGLGASAATQVVAPAADALTELVAEFDAFQKGLADAAKGESDRLTALQALLKDKTLHAKLDSLPEAGPYLDRVTKAARTRTTEQEQRQLVLKRIADADAELADLIARLR